MSKEVRCVLTQEAPLRNLSRTCTHRRGWFLCMLIYVSLQVERLQLYSQRMQIFLVNTSHVTAAARASFEGAV